MKTACGLLLCVALVGSVSSGDSIPRLFGPRAKAVAAAPAPREAPRELQRRLGDVLPLPPAPTPDPAPPVVVPTLTLPATVTANPGAWIVLTATTNCTHVIWDSDDATGNLNVLPEEMLANPLVTIASSIVPGQYRIKAIAAMADMPVQSDWCVITVLGPRPPPAPPVPPVPPVPPGPPQPPPAPTPPAPVALVGPLQIIVIYDSSAITPAVSALLAPAYWEAARKAGNTAYLFDSKNPQSAQWLTAIGNPKPPVVIFRAPDTTTRKYAVIDSMPLPATGAAMTALIQKYGGKAPAAAGAVR